MVLQTGGPPSRPTDLAPPPSRAQEFFLTSPQGIALIMDHLNAGIDDVIRNEVLLLAIEITTQNVQLQKIVVFAEAFVRTWAFMASFIP